MDINKTKPLARYNLANSFIRLIAKFLDLVIVIGIIIGVMFGLFYNTSPDYIPGWKILLLTIITFLLFNIYFIVIPFIFNGYTLFNRVFKIKIYSTLLKNIYINKWFKSINFQFLWQLFKRELFLWFLPCFFFLLFGFLSLAYVDDANNLILSIINKTSYSDSKSVFATLFITLISLSLLCPFTLIFNIILSSKKRSWNDYFSDTVVIKMKDVNSDTIDTSKNIKPKNKIKVKYSLPGEIDPDAINEIGE